MSLPPHGTPPPQQVTRHGAPLWQQPAPQSWAPFPQSTLRPPLTEAERRRLLRLGAASGALLGVGTGLAGVVLLFWTIVVGISALVTPLVIAFGGGHPLSEGLAEVVTPLTVGVVVIGTVLSLLGLALSWFGLRRWGSGRALGVTAASAAIAAVPVHLANIVVVLLMFVL